MSKYIYLEVFNGLANRLRAIDSACELAMQHDYRIVLIWPVYEGVTSEFESILQCVEPIERVINLWSGTAQQKIVTYAKRSVIRFNNHVVTNSNYQDEQSELELKGCAKLQNLLDNGKSFYVKTSRRLMDISSNYRWLFPTREILDKNQALVDELGLSSAIGLHVRRGDNSKSKMISSRNKFIRVVEQEVSKNPHCNIYLASDSEHEKQFFKDNFPANVVINQQTILDRTVQGNTVDAFVELLCLSRCGRIYGSFWSSYSIEAARIGGNEMIVVE